MEAIREVTQELRDKKWRKIREGTTGGWIAFVTSNVPSARGIGIVFGKYPRELDGQNGLVRWGNYGSPKKPQLTGTVAAVYRELGLDTGETSLIDIIWCLVPLPIFKRRQTC